MRIIYCLILTLLITFITQTVQAQAFNQFVAFGDSLSDDGNFSLIHNINYKWIKAPPKFTTNSGQVAVGDIASKLGFQLKPSFNIANLSNQKSIDYSVGAAGINHNGLPGSIPTISTQVNNYLKATAGQANPNAIYNLWGGANDIVYHINQKIKGNETLTQAKNAVVTAASKENSLINKLQQHGGQHIIVFNNYDLGKTPYAAKKGFTRQKILTSFSNAFNNKLNATLAGQSGIIPIDIYDLTKEIRNNPAHYGYKNVTNAACNGSSLQCGPQGSGAPNTYAPGTQNTYFYAFSVHPTMGTHTAFAQAALSELDAPGQISLLGEAPIASANAQLQAVDQSIQHYSGNKNNHVFMHLGYTHQTFDSMADSPGVHSNNINLTISINHPVIQHVSAGLEFGSGRASANIMHGQGSYHMTTASGTGYIAYHNQGTNLAAEIGYSRLYFNDIKRRFPIRAAVRTEWGNTKGNQIYGALTASHNFYLTRHFNSGPFGRVEWQHIHVNGYSEQGRDSTAMHFNSIKNNATIFSLGWNVHSNFQLLGHQVHPYAALAWHYNTQSHPINVTAGLKDMNGHFTLLGYNPNNNWGTVKAGLSVNLFQNIQGWIGYHGRFSDQSQSLNSLKLELHIPY